MRRIFLKVITLTLFVLSLASCVFSSNKALHGEALSKLDDIELYETVYFQNLDVVNSFESEELALKQMNSVRRTVYILSMYEYEISNGGLCQFFVNSSRLLAPYVSECLAEVGANEHKELFDEFIQDNMIDVNDLESFEINDSDEYAKQEARYDFNSFEEEYDALPLLKDILVRYIRNNINEF